MYDLSRNLPYGKRSLKYIGQVNRTISTARLNTLLHLHLRPINHVVYMGPDGEILSWSGLPT